MKLAAAGVPFEGVPAAHADDAHPREDIIRTAATRALGTSDSNFERAVYVGDGVWDVRAAAELGIGFVGIGESEAAERLRSAGSNVVFPNYLQSERFLNAIEDRALGPFSGR